MVLPADVAPTISVYVCVFVFLLVACRVSEGGLVLSCPRTVVFRFVVWSCVLSM